MLFVISNSFLRSLFIFPYDTHVSYLAMTKKRSSIRYEIIILSPHVKMHTKNMVPLVNFDTRVVLLCSAFIKCVELATGLHLREYFLSQMSDFPPSFEFLSIIATLVSDLPESRNRAAHLQYTPSRFQQFIWRSVCSPRRDRFFVALDQLV